MAPLVSPVVSPTLLPPLSTDKVSDQMPSANGQMPSHPSVDTSVTYISQQLASVHYKRQFRALLEHQRQVHAEERALWHIERSELEDHISRLQASLRNFQDASFSQTISPVSRQEPSNSLPPSQAGYGSRHANTGDEFWLGAGGKSDIQPTRTFSSASQQLNASSHLPSISENISPYSDRVKPSTISIQQTLMPKPNISEVKNSGTFDGITFKQSSRAPSDATNGVTARSTSSSHVSPETQTSRLALPNGFVTEHAGHTPVTRGSLHSTNDTSTALSIDTATPNGPQEERPPYEPHASFVKPPSERSDSYFSSVLADPPEDPSMAGPLGLSDSSSSEDQDFLHRVDSKLEEVAKQERDKSATLDQGSIEEPNILSEPREEVPPLRIKRSMNFGSQLGGSRGI